MRDQRGFALVITLIITALLVALTVEFVNEVFVDTSARQSFTDGQKASLLADSGVRAAISFMQYAQAKKDKSKELYTSQAELDQLAALLHIEDETGAIQVIVEDEGGKLNINKAWGDDGIDFENYNKIARRLVVNQGLSTDLLDALRDWRDTDDEQNGSGGAENSYYSTLKPPYTARNGNLATVEELRLVKGFDAAAFNRLSPFVTVYSDSPDLNINTAPKEVIQALSEDISEELAQEVVDYRKLHPFTIVDDLKNVPGMPETIVTNLQFTPPSPVKVKATVFRIHSEARVKETTRVVEAVVTDSGTFLYWREY